MSFVNLKSLGSAIFSGLLGFPNRKGSTTWIISSKASWIQGQEKEAQLKRWPRQLELEERAANRPTLDGSHLSTEGTPHLGQAVRLTWNYSRNNNLQNPLNRKMIIPDQTLAAVIGPEEIHCFQMMRNMHQHFIN